MHLKKEHVTLRKVRVKERQNSSLLNDDYNLWDIFSLVCSIGYSPPFSFGLSPHTPLPTPHLVCAHCCGSMVFHTLLGLSQNFWMAILTRLLLGLFNGLHGPANARCFSWMVWRISEIPLSHFGQLDVCRYIIMVEWNYIHAKRRNNLSLCTTHFKQTVNMFGFYDLWV
jgi:hypothetical protein